MIEVLEHLNICFLFRLYYISLHYIYYIFIIYDYIILCIVLLYSTYYYKSNWNKKKTEEIFFFNLTSKRKVNYDFLKKNIFSWINRSLSLLSFLFIIPFFLFIFIFLFIYLFFILFFLFIIYCCEKIPELLLSAFSVSLELWLSFFSLWPDILI